MTITDMLRDAASYAVKVSSTYMSVRLLVVQDGVEIAVQWGESNRPHQLQTRRHISAWADVESAKSNILIHSINKLIGVRNK